jgi:dolichol kinase
MNFRDELARKAIHLSSVLAPLLYGLLLHTAGSQARPIALIVSAPITLLLFVVDALRLCHGGFRALYYRHLGLVMRSDEGQRFCGATFVMISVMLCIALFPPPVAIAAMLFLSVSDALASLVGRAVGGPRWFGKSAAGSLAFFVSALLIALLCLPGRPLVALVGAALATIIEALPHQLGRIRLDDNLTVPVISGAVMAALLVLR